MGEWESKLKSNHLRSKNEDVGSILGVPSWMMVLLQRVLKETHVESISELWPNLEVFFFTVESALSPTGSNSDRSSEKTSITTKFTMLPKASLVSGTDQIVMRCC